MFQAPLLALEEIIMSDSDDHPEPEDAPEDEVVAEDDGEPPLDQEWIDNILASPTKKLLLIEKLGLGTGKDSPTVTGADPTLSGKSTGPTPSVSAIRANAPRAGLTQVLLPSEWLSRLGSQPSSSGSQDAVDVTEDPIDLLTEAEALELVEFDPSVTPENSWKPPEHMAQFLSKHFNRCLSDAEREAILKDFPRPDDVDVLQPPKLDEEVKDQLKKSGKDPHFGAEKSLYKLQGQVMDVAGPLSCLWADLLNPKASVSTENTLLLIQRALVLLGNASHSISLERRKIAWTRINPRLKSLATEEYAKRESNLFGPGFLEKASKKLESEKALSRVAGLGGGSEPPAKRTRYANDKNDLRSFLSKGAPASYGGRQQQRHQPFTPNRFKGPRYFKGPRPTKNPPQEKTKSAQQ